MNTRLLGAILCGGKSNRMGRDKAAIQCKDSRTYLELALDRITPVCDLVCQSGSCSMDSTVPIVEDRYVDKGPISGIASSLIYGKQNHCAGCLFTPIDVPLLSTQDLLTLKRHWIDSPTRLVVATGRNGNNVEPLIAIYPVDGVEQLQQRINDGILSLFDWVGMQNPIQVTLTPRACTNINTPEDLIGG